MILPDILQPNLNVIFCGTAASAASAKYGAYYAHPGNRFWRTLHEVGLTDRQLTPDEFTTLPKYGIGLTDLNKHESGNDADLSKTGFDAYGVKDKIQKFKPDIVAFTSKRAGMEFLELKNSKYIHYGEQKQKVGKTRLWVLPSTSGLASGSWDVSYWHALAKYLQT